LLLTALWAGGDPVSQAFENVGAQNCKTCHQAEYQQWSAGPHARTLDPLDEQQRADQRCLKCHALQTAGKFEPVSCEACHGGGEYYVHKEIKLDHELARASGLQDPDEKTCLRCHTGHSPALKPFVYAEALKRIEHWTPGKKKARDYEPVLQPGSSVE
jgi:hypothetical protein